MGNNSGSNYQYRSHFATTSLTASHTISGLTTFTQFNIFNKEHLFAFLFFSDTSLRMQATNLTCKENSAGTRISLIKSKDSVFDQVDMKCSTLVLSSLSPLPPSTKNQSPCLGNTLPQSQSHFNHQTVSFSAPVLGFEYLQPICQSQTHFSFKREIILPPFLSIFLQLTFAVYHELLPFISSKILSDLGKWFASTLLGRYN